MPNTDLTPAAFRTVAQAESVAPVVVTSSMSHTVLLWRSTPRFSLIEKAFRILE